MNIVLVDGLVKALASLIEDANSINCLETSTESEKGPRSPSQDLSLIIDAFRDLLSEGRNVSGVEIETCRTPFYPEDMLGFSTQGAIQLFWGTGTRTYHITIRQQRGHAQGGTP